MSGFDHVVILAPKGLIQASKYAAMVTPSTLTVEKGGFNVSVSFLWSKKYPFGKKVNYTNSLANS